MFSGLYIFITDAYIIVALGPVGGAAVEWCSKHFHTKLLPQLSVGALKMTQKLPAVVFPCFFSSRFLAGINLDLLQKWLPNFKKFSRQIAKEALCDYMHLLSDRQELRMTNHDYTNVAHS